MGKRKHDNLPPRMRLRTRTSGKRDYYYEAEGRKLIPLGSDYTLALRQWAVFECDTNPLPQTLTFRAVAERYRLEVMPTKSFNSQRQNQYELNKLLEFFDDPPVMIEAIKPIHVRQYLDWRRGVPASANREIGLLSHIWNKAREWGYTDLANPVQGVKKFTTDGRDVYIEDDMFRRVWEKADEPLRDAMDLAYLTGQRPADVLKIMETDIRDGAIQIKQNKTGSKLRITIKGELEVLITRILARKRAIQGVRALHLICNEQGQPLTYYALDARFGKARAKAGIGTKEFQFRDLRAKAGTDKADAEGSPYAAQRLLGHTTVNMSEHYIRDRRGQKVDPTK